MADDQTNSFDDYQDDFLGTSPKHPKVSKSPAMQSQQSGGTSRRKRKSKERLSSQKEPQSMVIHQNESPTFASSYSQNVQAEKATESNDNGEQRAFGNENEENLEKRSESVDQMDKVNMRLKSELAGLIS